MKTQTEVTKVFIAIIIIAVAISGWLGSTLIGEQEKASLERHTYEGTVTALQHHEDRTSIWLNSEPEVISVRGTIELTVEETYEITVDGRGNLINAKILGEKEGEN